MPKLFGALRGVPAEGVTENGKAGRSQGKAFPQNCCVQFFRLFNRIQFEKIGIPQSNMSGEHGKATGK